MQDLFTNKFPLDGKIKLSVAGVSENGRKNGFNQTENQFTLAGIRIFFKNWIFSMVSTRRKKSPNKRILFQVDRKLVSTSRNGEFV